MSSQEEEVRRDKAGVSATAVPCRRPSRVLMHALWSRCLNCQKNAVVCEGYPPKEIWRSGKQKMADGMRF